MSFFFPNNHHFCKGKFQININKNDDNDDNNDNDDDQIDREKFLKKNHQERDIKMIRKKKILKSSLLTTSITSGTRKFSACESLSSKSKNWRALGIKYHEFSGARKNKEKMSAHAYVALTVASFDWYQKKKKKDNPL